MNETDRGVKLLLVEDVPFDARSTMGLLQDAGYKYIESVASAIEARDALKQNSYQLVIVDLKVPPRVGEPDAEKHGIDLIDDIKAIRLPQFVLSRYTTQNSVAQVLTRGVGYIKKDDISHFALLDHAIQTTLRGGIVFSRTPLSLIQALAARQNHRSDPNRPSRREREAIYLFVFKYGGKMGADERVAEIMNVTPQTAREHRRNLSQKLDLHSQAEVVSWAHRNPHEFDDIRELHKDIPDAG